MSTLEDLAVAVKKNDDDVNALIAAVKAIPAGALSAADQATLDAAVAQLATTDANVEAETAAETPPTS